MSHKLPNPAQPTADPIPLARWFQDGERKELELVDLVPPYTLSGGLWACRLFLTMIAEGTIQRSRRSIMSWIEDPRQRVSVRGRRRVLFEQAMALLNGRTLEEAEDAFTLAYTAFLASDRGVLATCLVITGLRDRDEDLELVHLSESTRAALIAVTGAPSPLAA